MIYLDHNATTPLDPAVLDRMLPFLTTEFGNASSVHRAGQRARAAVDDAREQVATAFGCAPKEVVFTSGGTEADNLALRGVFAARRVERRRIVTTCVEHPAVLETARALAGEGADLCVLPVDREGRLSLDELSSAVTSDTALVSVMWVNNETGVVFPVEQVGALCRERGVPLHVDAVQAAGRLPIDLSTLPIDLLTVSAHKFGGPKGVGALIARKGGLLWAVQTGGHQERGRRAGTENAASIVGFGAAAQLAARRIGENQRLSLLRDRLAAEIGASVPDVVVVGESAPRIGNTLNVCFKDVQGEELLMALDLAEICASSGSACTAGSLEPSHVIRAMGLAPEWARGAVRFSFGRQNTEADVAGVAELLPGIIRKLRRR